MANEFFNYYADQRDRNPGLSDEDIIDNALDENSLSLLTKMGLYTYLIDVVRDQNGVGTVFSRAEESGHPQPGKDHQKPLEALQRLRLVWVRI